MARPELQDGRKLKRANPKTIQDKFLVGYQGWFTCAGDGQPVGPGHHGWLHWFNAPIPSGGRPNTDLWPDVSEYSPSELFPAPGLKNADGDQVFLFSSRHPKTVQRHFHWMALHGVDGAFLQRFAGQCDIESGNTGIRDIRDEVGDRVKEAAEAEGRVYAIMYDVSGVSPDTIQGVLERDWVHLLRDRGLLDSKNYLREKGKPVVALWGFGSNGRNHTPELVRSITDFFRSSTPGGAYIVAGVPGHWRTSTGDADRNPEFVRVWTECFDAISPWTVGRYSNEEEADRWGEVRVKADAEYLKKLEEEGGRKVDYMPVVLPGGSGYNLSQGKWAMNGIQRNGGRFLWKQIYNARRAGVRTIYGAMWDEYDEGTAFMPVVSTASQLPVHPDYTFVALDVDGYDLPSDWYMRIVGFAAEAFHAERTLLDTFPVKELQDYWGTRPHYEEIDDEEERKRQLEEVTRAFREWEMTEGNAGGLNDAPPPPYSLEASPPPEVVELPPVQGSSSGSAGGSRGGGGVANPPARVMSPQHYSSAGSGLGSFTALPGEVVLSPPMASHSLSAPSTTPAPSTILAPAPITSSSSSSLLPPPRHPRTTPVPPLTPLSSSSTSPLLPPPRHPSVSSFSAPPVDLSTHPRRSATPGAGIRVQNQHPSTGPGVGLPPPPLPVSHPPRNRAQSVSASHPQAPSPTTYQAPPHPPSIRPGVGMGVVSPVVAAAGEVYGQRGREPAPSGSGSGSGSGLRHRRSSSSSSGSRKRNKSPKGKKQKSPKRPHSPRRLKRPSTAQPQSQSQSQSQSHSLSPHPHSQPLSPMSPDLHGRAHTPLPSPHEMGLGRAHSGGGGGSGMHGPYTPGHPQQQQQQPQPQQQQNYGYAQLGHTSSGSGSGSGSGSYMPPPQPPPQHGPNAQPSPQPNPQPQSQPQGYASHSQYANQSAYMGGQGYGQGYDQHPYHPQAHTLAHSQSLGHLHAHSPPPPPSASMMGGPSGSNPNPNPNPNPYVYPQSSPSSASYSSYYPTYAPPPGPPPGFGAAPYGFGAPPPVPITIAAGPPPPGGGGGLMNTAFNVVEDLAGTGRRRQLEQKVMNLTHSFGIFK